MQIKSTKGVSPEFKNFMISLQKWIDEGCKEKQPFSNYDSICFQIAHYVPYDDKYLTIQDDLDNTLPGFGEEWATPFNDGDYSDESWAGTHYKNPKRLAWIKAVVNSFGEEK